MFRGDSAALRGVTRGAVALARRLGCERVGAEHLLISLGAQSASIGEVLASHGLATSTLTQVAGALGPGGAAAAADRALLGEVGVDIDRLIDGDMVRALDVPPRRQPLFPIGASAAPRRAARPTPRLGLDYLADYEASLRLALARRERESRPEHLAFALTLLDAGARWMIATCGADPDAVAAHLSAVFPPPERNPLLRIERRMACSLRAGRICARYRRRTGHFATADALVPAVSN